MSTIIKCNEYNNLNLNTTSNGSIYPTQHFPFTHQHASFQNHPMDVLGVDRPFALPVEVHGH